MSLRLETRKKCSRLVDEMIGNGVKNEKKITNKVFETALQISWKTEKIF